MIMPAFMQTENDSYRACVASLLAANVETVPHFVGPDIDIDTQIGMMRDYLKKEHGARLIVITIAPTEPTGPGFAYDNAHLMSPGLPCIIWGNDSRDVPHCVVARNGWADHDPHPGEIGLHGPLGDGKYYLQWVVKPFWERPTSTRRRGATSGEKLN